MINKNKLLKKTPVLFGTPDEVYKEFLDYGDCSPLPKHLTILYADYTYEDYTGDCYILGYNKLNKQFFEINGSHCSCYELEGQWDEEYYESWELLSKCIEKRFEALNGDDYYRYANSSKELHDFLS